MRIYDFRCDECGKSFEVFQRSADESRTCPECGSSRSSLQPNLQISIRTSNTRRGRVIDMSSNACPCCAKGHRHAHH